MQRLLDQVEAESKAAEENNPGSPSIPKTTTKVLADGTYATETVYSSNAAAAKLDSVKSAHKPPLRSLILGGDFYTGSVLAATLTKLVLRFAELSVDPQSVNELRAEAMLMMTSIIRVGQSQFSAVPIDEDSVERITTCLNTLTTMGSNVKQIFLRDTKAAYASMVSHQEKKALERKAKESMDVRVQADDLISFRQFSTKNSMGVDDVCPFFRVIKIPYTKPS